MERADEASIAFKHAADELRFFKAQQWSMTNYALAAQAGIFAAVTHLRPEQAGIGIACSLILGALAVFLLTITQSGIVKERARMYEARTDLPRLEAIHERKLPWFARNATVVVLGFVNAGACLFVILMICSS